MAKVRVRAIIGRNSFLVFLGGCYFLKAKNRRILMSAKEYIAFVQG